MQKYYTDNKYLGTQIVVLSTSMIVLRAQRLVLCIKMLAHRTLMCLLSIHMLVISTQIVQRFKLSGHMLYTAVSTYYTNST